MSKILTIFGQVNNCQSSVTDTFFTFPTWYKYLESAGYLKESTASKTCELYLPGQFDWNVFTLIGLGVLDILIRLAGLIAVGFVIYGGILYVTSRGEPDKAKKAMSTILNALIGLAIAVVAAAFVSFLAGRLSA